jgi:hypothetical protein
VSLERIGGQNYSGHMTTYRIPPSLNWLIDNRRRISGQIELVEKKLERFAKKYASAKIVVDQHDIHMPRLLRSLKADLKALDQTIGMHEIPIDPELVPGIREQARRPSYGTMTPIINACLALDPDGWKTTTEIASFVAAKRCPDMRAGEFPPYRDAIKRRLKVMLRGRLVEHIDARGLRKESLWRRKARAVSSSEAQSPDDFLGNTRETTEIDLPGI